MNTTSPRYRLPTQQSRTKHQDSWWLKSWRYTHWLSFDVALGAGLSAEWVNHAWHGQSLAWVSIAIMSAALCVYSLDHWAEARRAASQPLEQLSKRRLFYVHSQNLLLLLGILSSCSGLWAASHLPLTVLVLGSCMLLICAYYLWSIQNKQKNKRSLNYSKEVIVTSVYATALSLWPLSQVFDPTIELSLINGMLTSFLIFNFAWANVCLISVHERRQDAAEDLPSLALSLGEYTTKNIGRGLLKLSLALCLVRTYVQWTYFTLPLSNIILEGLICLGMSLTLWRLYQRPEWSKVRERYRRWADAIFLYPALLWFWLW